MTYSEDVNLRFNYEGGLGMTLGESFRNSIDAFNDIPDEDMDKVVISMDITVPGTDERVNVFTIPFSEFFGAFEDLLDVSDIGEIEEDVFAEIFDKFENPALSDEMEAMGL